MNRFDTKRLALLVVTAGAIYLCWQLLVPFIDVVAWAAVLVIVFYPVHKRIAKRLSSPGWGAIVSCLLVILTILLPLSLVTLAVVNEATKFANKMQEGGGLSLLDPDSPTIKPILDRLGQYINVDQLRSREFLVERLRGVSGTIANRTIGVVGGLAGAIVQVFFIIFTMYYFFRDGENIRHAIYSMLPTDRQQSHEIFERTRDVISASVYGVLVIAVIQGVMGGAAFWFLGIPSPLLWTAVMILLCFIPMLGAFVVWIPAAIYLLATGSIWQGIVLIIWGAGPIGMIDNFLRPKLVGDKTRLHELLIFFSVLGGLQVFGVLGIVLGPVVVVVTLALIDVLRKAEQPDAQAAAEPTLAESQSTLRNVPEERGGAAPLAV